MSILHRLIRSWLIDMISVHTDRDEQFKVKAEPSSLSLAPYKPHDSHEGSFFFFFLICIFILYIFKIK